MVELLDGRGALLDEAAIEEGIVISVERRTRAIEFLPGGEAAITLRTGTELGSPRDLEVWLPGQGLANGLRITIGTEAETRGVIAALRQILGADA